ncbi:hypothetical protein LPJ72_001195 [Coemansia sp. Benny D160-2]|nr:hypothetical protein LPJ72_001195 [Coemansia sp. Benny D160-2]
MEAAALQNALNDQTGSNFVKRLVDGAENFALLIESVLLDRTPAFQKETNCLDDVSRELVLNVYEKLADSLEDPASQEYAHKLQNEYILVGATLFDLASAYGKTHPERIRAILSSLYDRAPWLSSELEASSDLLADQTLRFRSEFAESLQMRHVEDSKQRIELMCTDLELQISIATSWLFLVEFCKPTAGTPFQGSLFIVELAKMWDVVSKQLIKTKTIMKSPSEVIERFERLSKELKWQWSGFAFYIMQGVSKRNGEVELDSMQAQTPGVGFAAFLDILNSMETLDAPLVPFVNSPFLLDMEFRFGIRKTIAEAADSDKAQLDYLSMSIDQLVSMSDPLYRDGFRSLNEMIHRIEDAGLATVDENISTKAQDISSDDNNGEQSNQVAIAQIRELLPDLGAGFICACLDYYDQNVEAVIGSVLEDSLPLDLANMDRALAVWKPSRDNTAVGSKNETDSDAEGSPGVQPAGSVLESRRNIFDNDEFDIFNRGSLDWSRVSKGKTQKPAGVRSPDNHLKSRIMEIAQRMDDEDEYDDTYDETAQDGAADTLDVDELTSPSNSQKPPANSDSRQKVDPQEASADPIRPWEDVLVHQYLSNPKVLERNKLSRKLPERQALKTKTGLSDEQLEGWFIMFQRNPRQKSVLTKYEFHGNQNRIGNATRPSDSSLPSSQGNGQNPAVSESSSQNYNKKGKNKAKIGNHNRKQQHDRKTRHIFPTSSE